MDHILGDATQLTRVPTFKLTKTLSLLNEVSVGDDENAGRENAGLANEKTTATDRKCRTYEWRTKFTFPIKRRLIKCRPVFCRRTRKI